MHKVVLICLAISTAPAAARAQQDSTQRQALVAALEAVRADLPDKGQIVLIARNSVATPEEKALAKVLGAEARQHRDLSECTADNPRSCRLRDAVGALGVQRVEPTGSDRLRVVVETIVPMTLQDRQWLYFRSYAVDLAREGSGTWKVVAVGMMSQS